MIQLNKTFLALTLTFAGSLSAADFFPLANGNSWTYRDASTGSTFEVRAHEPALVNGRVYHFLSGFTPETLLARVNENNNLVALDEAHEVETVLAGFQGSPVAYSTNRRECPAFANTKEKRGEHQGPAGHWSVVEVEYQPYACADAGDLLEQFAENIGMVRRVVSTIAGPRTFDLVRARVGNQSITAGETGRFTVSALPGTDRGSWQVTLRVDPFSGSGIRLRFPSSQEYDLRLRDTNGNVLWTWSANKLFAPAEHVVSIGGWSAEETVPHPPAVPEGPQSYVLEAWLTPAQGEPQFAAATSLDLAAPFSVRWVDDTAVNAGRSRR
jgi:hypothetical protein